MYPIITKFIPKILHTIMNKFWENGDLNLLIKVTGGHLRFSLKTLRLLKYVVNHNQPDASYPSQYKEQNPA